MNESHETTAEVIEPTTRELAQTDIVDVVNARFARQEMSRVSQAGWSVDTGRMAMDRQRFDELHGRSIPVGRNGVKNVCRDGAFWHHDGFGPVFCPPPLNPIDRLSNQLDYWKERLLLAQNALEHYRIEKRVQEQSQRGVMTFGLSTRQWDIRDLGQPPLNEHGRFDLDIAVERCQAAVKMRVKKCKAILAELQQLNPNINFAGRLNMELE